MNFPFLTDLDSRAQIKGSRDPLGVQAIWTRLGRHVIGNLTTVTSSVRDFTVTLLGYYLAEQVAEATGESNDLKVFLRWEQLAAYARGGENKDWVFRGTERARGLWGDGSRVRIAAESDSYILSDQKTYGLWGLFTVPSRSSGLIEGSPSRLTLETREFVESQYLPAFGGNASARGQVLIDMLRRPNYELRPKGRDQVLFEAVAKVLRRRFSGAERTFYTRHLVEGGPTDSTQGGQRRLADAMRTSRDLGDLPFSPTALSHLAKQCWHTGGESGERVAVQLERIRVAEQFLAPCVDLFAYLQSNDDQPLATVAGAVRKQWGPGLRAIDPEALEAVELQLRGASGGPEAAKLWLAIAEALRGGDYTAAIESLVAQNRDVMARRGGAAPWLEVRDGQLRVKVGAEAGKLPSRQELPELWRHSYFLDSLRSITRELEP